MSSELSETSRPVDRIGYDGGLHCDLRVTDLGRSLDWYTDVLGFTVIHHVADAGWAELQTPVKDVRVGLTAVETMPPPGGGAVLTFNVRDIETARRYLETRDDVRFDGETCTIEGWVRLATVFDPDGNTLMLAESLFGRPGPS
jgi:catechol 2,3-dioxygenase-like lactoylglutathione lyase family enzyme